MPGGRRWVLPLALVVASTTVLGAAWVKHSTGPRGWSGAPPAVQAILWPEPAPVAGFSLLDQHGAPFGHEHLPGEWTFMFFGYLGCPDVCPMTLYAMKVFRDELVARDAAAAAYRFMFVSVDPEHDSPSLMAEYLESYYPGFIGLAGAPDQLRELASSMSVMYAESISPGGMRSMDHTSSIMVLDPRGRVVASLPPPHDPEQMLLRFTELRTYLRGR